MSDVFVSYSRLDATFGKRLHRWLTEAERDVWMDWEDIPPTADWWQEIEEGINAADNFVLIMSPDSIGSPVCQLEILTAINSGKRIIPLMHRDVDPETTFQKAVQRTRDDEIVQNLLGAHDPLELCKTTWSTLAHLNWVFFDNEADFEAKVQELNAILDLHLEHTKEHTRLLTRAIEWDQKGRMRAHLLRGREVEEAALWLAQAQGKHPNPTQRQTEYIIASRQNQRRTILIVLGGVATALVVSLVLATWAGITSIQLRSTSNELRFAAATQAVNQTRIVELVREIAVAATADAVVAATDVAFNNFVGSLEPAAVVFADGAVNVRSGPSLAFGVVAGIEPNVPLRVLGFVTTEGEGEWAVVQLENDATGYIQGALVATNRELRTVQTTTAEMAATQAYLLTPTATRPVTATAPPQPTVTIAPELANAGSGVALGDVNVRAGPGLFFDVVGIVADGDEVAVTDFVESEDEGTWIEVLLPDDTRGYIAADGVIITVFPQF